MKNKEVQWNRLYCNTTDKHVIGGEYTFKDHAWNEVSGRYVQYEEFWRPEYFRQSVINKKQGSLDEVHPNNEYWLERYNKHVEETKKFYDEMIVDGIPNEQARSILGINLFTEFWWTISFQGLAHFVNLRNHEHAQKEICVYAVAMDELMIELFPELWEQHGRL